MGVGLNWTDAVVSIGSAALAVFYCLGDLVADIEAC